MSTNLARKITSVALAFATAVFVSGSVIPFASAAMTQAEMLAEIERLMVLITQLRGQLGQTSPVASCTFDRDLTVGMRGADVTCLQDYLTSTGDFTYAGGSTGTFGPVTRAAVSAWQRANSVSPTAGYFGSRSKAKYMSLVAAGTPTPTPTGTGTPTPTPVGSGLTVALAADQPAGSLAPYNAARIPFTKLALTAGTDGEVTVTGIVVQRTGLAEDGSLDSVMLLDQDGNQLGLKKTLNSEHKATVGQTMAIPAGTTKYVTIAATRTASGSRGGQSIAVSVTGVNVSGSTVVNGTFPMTGATHTVNETLAIGTVTMARGSYDPGSSVTKNLGETGYTFAGVRITAGSAEKVYIKSIRWNQTGSAGSGDLAEVKTVVDGTAYDTVLSADGKYYTATLPGMGMLIDKGFSKDVSVKGNIVGGSGRTIDFDLAKRTDLFLIGENFGYGIVPAQTGLTVPTADSSNFSSSEDPWYDSSQVTVSAGTVTVSNSSAVPPANVAINLNNQILGGWTVDVKGEPVQVSSLKVNVNVSQSGGSAGGADDVTNVALYDASGRTLAGPLDVGSTALAYATITFTDTITFPVGVTNMVLKGKFGTNFANNDTVAASTTPNGWTATGQNSGNTVTPSPTTAITSSSMTVKSLALTISVQSTPGAQSVVGGAQNFEMARYTYDASQSGEDAKMASVPLAIEFIGGTTDKISGCKLYDGTAANAPALTTGSNVVDPTASRSPNPFHL